MTFKFRQDLNVRVWEFTYGEQWSREKIEDSRYREWLSYGGIREPICVEDLRLWYRYIAMDLYFYQKIMAKYVGVSSGYLNEIINGKARITDNMASRTGFEIVMGEMDEKRYVRRKCCA